MKQKITITKVEIFLLNIKNGGKKSGILVGHNYEEEYLNDRINMTE